MKRVVTDHCINWHSLANFMHVMNCWHSALHPIMSWRTKAVTHTHNLCYSEDAFTPVTFRLNSLRFWCECGAAGLGWTQYWTQTKPATPHSSSSTLLRCYNATDCEFELKSHWGLFREQITSVTCGQARQGRPCLAKAERNTFNNSILVVSFDYFFQFTLEIK